MARGPEAKIQDAVVRYAREKYGTLMIARKFQAGVFGTNGWPDYEFLLKGGKVFHIEFKKPNGTCTPLQLQRHNELRAIGHTVYVCDNAFQGKRVIDKEINILRGRKSPMQQIASMNRALQLQRRHSRALASA